MKLARVLSVETTKDDYEDFGVLFMTTGIVVNIRMNRDKHPKLFVQFMNYLRDGTKFDFDKVQLEESSSSPKSDEVGEIK